MNKVYASKKDSKGIIIMKVEQGWTIIDRISQNDYLILIFRIILGAAFIFASVSKIAQPQEFILTVKEYNILFEPFTAWYGYLLPWVELIFGFTLIAGFFTRISTAIINLATISFLIAIIVNIYRGAGIDCGCFGSDDPLGWNTYFRDLILFLLGVLIFLSTRNRFSIDNWIKRD